MVWQLPHVPDGTKFHHPIQRIPDAIQTIGMVCAASSIPVACALMLDVLAARESGYHRHIAARDGTMHEIAGDCPGMPAGDRDCTREKGARSCGPFQTPCGKTPAGMSALDQTKLALKTLEQSIQGCPNHPLWQYATGECKYSKTAQDYEDIVKRNAAEVP